MSYWKQTKGGVRRIREMKLLKQEQDRYILDTVHFMMKVDESFRKRIHRYARFSYNDYQEELEQKENQHLHIIPGGKV